MKKSRHAGTFLFRIILKSLPLVILGYSLYKGELAIAYYSPL